MVRLQLRVDGVLLMCEQPPQPASAHPEQGGNPRVYAERASFAETTLP